MDWIHLAQERDQWATLNETSSFIKCREILELLSDWRLLKKDSSAWN
jgi:hypothetical protein